MEDFAKEMVEQYKTTKDKEKFLEFLSHLFDDLGD